MWNFEIVATRLTSLYHRRPRASNVSGCTARHDRSCVVSMLHCSRSIRRRDHSQSRWDICSGDRESCSSYRNHKRLLKWTRWNVMELDGSWTFFFYFVRLMMKSSDDDWRINHPSELHKMIASRVYEWGRKKVSQLFHTHTPRERVETSWNECHFSLRLFISFFLFTIISWTFVRHSRDIVIDAKKKSERVRDLPSWRDIYLKHKNKESMKIIKQRENEKKRDFHFDSGEWKFVDENLQIDAVSVIFASLWRALFDCLACWASITMMISFNLSSRLAIFWIEKFFSFDLIFLFFLVARLTQLTELSWASTTRPCRPNWEIFGFWIAVISLVYFSFQHDSHDLCWNSNSPTHAMIQLIVSFIFRILFDLNFRKKN